MTQINSVLGTVDTTELGFTLMHEHILFATCAMVHAFDDWIDRDAVVDAAVRELQAAKQRGVNAIVDATPINGGRDIHVIREVAARAEVHIIAATGLYWFDEPWLAGWEVDRIAEFMIRDVEGGIQGTDSRAGIIKAATDQPGVTPLNRKGLQIAARVHLATGVPIITHTSAARRTGLAQQDVFEEEGVDLGRVVIGHCGDTDDVAYLEEILERGSFIAMDRFGLEGILPDEKRVDTVAQLCCRGWADRMVLSHDHCCAIDWSPAGLERPFTADQKFCHIPDAVIPALRQASVGDEQIEAMTVRNPARVFAR
jgi:phosphotriesterase-related protein